MNIWQIRWVTLDKSWKARDPLLLGDASVSLTSSLRPIKVLEDPFNHCQMPYFIVMALIMNHHHTNLCLTIDVHNFTHQSPPCQQKLPKNNTCPRWCSQWSWSCPRWTVERPFGPSSPQTCSSSLHNSFDFKIWNIYYEKKPLKCVEQPELVAKLSLKLPLAE